MLETDAPATPAARALAELVVNPDRLQRPREVLDVTAVERHVLHQRIRLLRQELVESPRNAIVRVDLARIYAILGQQRQAVRAMEIALRAAPTNRFVLRSACRLFVHIDEPDRAHELLQKSDRTRSDPWLMAAEIAAASVAERGALSAKRGRRLLEAASLSPHHLAELASAIATLDLSAGDARKARRWFRQSLADPTENAVAQAGWASQRVSGVEVGRDLIEKARSHEAEALRDYREGRWSEAIKSCEAWLLDEPFSSRPAALGSYLASVAAHDYRLAEQLARRGLTANPDDPLLINNLVVALANQGRVEEAEGEFRRIQTGTAEALLRATLVATEGLLHFRRGAVVQGRDFYRKAMELATGASSRRTLALAAVHLAREELLARSEEALPALQVAVKACEGLEAWEVLEMLEELRRVEPGTA